jgi:dCTP deaminase
LILTDRELRIAIDHNIIVISPKPKSDQYASTSIDLTLDENIVIFQNLASGLDVAISPGSPDYDFSKVLSSISKKELISSNGFKLEPRTLILAWTKEEVDLKNTSKIAARVEGKSSLARIGLGVHITAPTIHAGFKGRIQLEVINHGPLPIKLIAGMRVCQLIFEQTLGVPEAGYQGQFLGQQA